MKRILLDSSAFSAAARGELGVKNVLQLADEVFVNPVILGELSSGFLAGPRAEDNRLFLERFLASDRVRVAPIDPATAERYALIHAWLRREGRPIPSNDIWIAATAMQHGLELVTTDERFQHLPQIAVSVHPAH